MLLRPHTKSNTLREFAASLHGNAYGRLGVGARWRKKAIAVKRDMALEIVSRIHLLNKSLLVMELDRSLLVSIRTDSNLII